MTDPLCAHCGKPRVVATSATTGCCIGEQFEALWGCLGSALTWCRQHHHDLLDHNKTGGPLREHSPGVEATPILRSALNAAENTPGMPASPVSVSYKTHESTAQYVAQLRAELAAARSEVMEERNHREKAENIAREAAKQRDAARTCVATHVELLGEAQGYIPRDPCTQIERALHARIEAAREAAKEIIK